MSFRCSALGRSLRVGLVGAVLTPLLTLALVVAGPTGTAAAAVSVTKHSGTTGIAWSPDNWRSAIPGHYINCTATLIYSVYGTAAEGLQNLLMKGGNCDTGPGLNISGFAVTVDVTGARQDGTVCASQGVTSVNEDDDETLSTLAISFGSVSPATACTVTEVCFQFDSGGIVNQEWKDCTTVAMGSPVFPTEQGGQTNQTCSEGGLKAVNSGAPFLTDPDHAYVDVTLTWTDNTPVGQTWRVVWIMTPPGTMAPYTGNNIRSNVVVPANRTTTKRIQVASYPVPASPANWTKFVGAMTYPAYSPYGGAAGYTTEFNELYLPAQGVLGTSDVSKCRFYFGPKIAEVPDSTIDEPLGSVNAAPPPPPSDDVEPDAINPPPVSEVESSCDFSITDPATWLEGGMCAAVGLLGAIAGLLADALQLLLDLVSAVTGLAAELLEGIGTLLETLFVPEPGSWDLDGLKDQASTRPPFSFAEDGYDTVTTLGDTYSAADGCSLPLFEFDDVPDGTLDCQGIKAAPGGNALFTLVQVALITLTGIAIVRIILGTVSTSA